MAETMEITWEVVHDEHGSRLWARFGIVLARLETVWGEGWGWRVTGTFPHPTEAEPLTVEVTEWGAPVSEAEARAHAEAVMRRMNAWWEQEQASG